MVTEEKRLKSRAEDFRDMQVLEQRLHEERERQLSNIDDRVSALEAKMEARIKAEVPLRFCNMTSDEIDEFESKTDSIVLFDGETGINFQRAYGNDGVYLSIKIDGIDYPFSFAPAQVDALNKYLNKIINRDGY